jgi:L-rhamnose mutarotase
MEWKKIEDSNYNEWELVDSNNNQLIVIGYYDICGRKTYRVYQNKPLSFLFNYYEERIDVRSMKNMVQREVSEWMKIQLGV